MKKNITKVLAAIFLLSSVGQAHAAFNLKEKLKPKTDDEKYAEYLIPTEGYMPVGNNEDRTIKIEGGVSKSLELNLADCLELALINNPRIKAAYANANAIKTHRGQTLSNYSPRVSLQSGISRMKPDITSTPDADDDPFGKYMLGTIGIRQLIFDFGATANQYKIDKLQHQESLDNIDAVVNDVVFQIKDSYYYLMLAIENRSVMQETVEQFEQMRNQAKAFYDVGMRAKIDVTMAEVNLEDARARLIEANYAADVAISRLNNAMGLPFIAPYIVENKLPFENIDITMKQAVEIANSSRPELKMALSGIKIADQYVKLTKKTAFPQLQFAADVSAGQVDSNDMKNWYNLGGYLVFPLVNPFLIKNQVNEAKALYEKQQYDTKGAVNNIYFEIQQTYAKMVESRERVPVAKLSVKSALLNYDIAKGRYKVGLSDPIELKDAQLMYQNSRLNYLKTLYDYNSAKAMLEKSVGQTLKNEEQKAEEIEI